MMNRLNHCWRRLGGPVAILALLAAGGCASGPLSAAPSAGSAAESGRIAELRQRFLNPNGPVMVVAHRACWTTTAENSLAAIAECRRLGVDMVELDVQRTRDGHLVLMHDTTVDRTTNGSGRVSDLTLAQIKALRLKRGAGGDGAPLTAEAPPTFAEAMAATRGAVLVNVDAKGEIKLLEVNPNPGWCWDGKLNIMAGWQGMRYSDLLGQILQAAVERLAITARPAVQQPGVGLGHSLAAE